MCLSLLPLLVSIKPISCLLIQKIKGPLSLLGRVNLFKMIILFFMEKQTGQIEMAKPASPPWRGWAGLAEY